MRMLRLRAVNKNALGMAEVPRDARFWTDLLRRVTQRMRGHPDAEDLLHSAYLRLEAYRLEQQVENPAAFVVQAAKNIAIDNYRHDRLTTVPSDRAALLEVMDKSPLQDEVIEARARLKHVSEGLAKMSPRTREVFLMHRLDGLKYREIATALGISQSAVEKHIAKATLFLVEWMEGW